MDNLNGAGLLFSGGLGIIFALITKYRLWRWQACGLKIKNRPEGHMIFAFMVPTFSSFATHAAISLTPLQLGEPWHSCVCLCVAGALGFASQLIVKPSTPVRHYLENSVKALLIICTAITILTTFAIVLSVLFESLRFFSFVPLTEFIFGTHWSPHNATAGDVAGHFGTLPLFVGTLIITMIALMVAGPIGLFSATYMAFYASPKLRHSIKPLLELLAGIPTVVYGFFAIVFVAPLVRKMGLTAGLDVATESALIAGLVMGIMIVPFISSLTDDVLYALPQALRDGSLGLGSTYAETIKKILLPAAFPGIASAFLLAISRAIGETMLVVMAAGMSANMTLNPLQPVTTVTVQIVSILTGDQEFNSPKTLVAFALGLALFIATFALNFVAFQIVRSHRIKHESH